MVKTQLFLYLCRLLYLHYKTKAFLFKNNDKKEIKIMTNSYTLAEKDQNEKLIKQSHLPLKQKIMKYLGINLPKEAKYLYTESYKVLLK